MLVNIHEAKTQFSRLVDRALAGESVVIAKNGKPLLTLTPLPAPSTARRPGLSRGRGAVGEDFDSPLPNEVQEEFE